MTPLYIYDPTQKDALSRVRGVGRYFKILQENLSQEAAFTANLASIPYESAFVNPFLSPLGFPLTLKRVAKRQVAVLHDIIPLLYPSHFPTGVKAKINSVLNTLLLKNYDLIVTDSQKSKDDIVTTLGVKESKIKVVYPTVQKLFSDQKTSTKSSRSKNNKDLPSKYCLYVGDVTWNKNIVTLAHAIKLGDIPCVFVGKTFLRSATSDPWDKEFKEFQVLAKDDERFVFPGFVSDGELLNYYKNAVCNMLVSRDEGFGFTYLEASNLSCPSVLSDIPVFHEVASDAAVFAKVDDPQEISEKIKMLAENTMERADLAKKAKERSNFFSPEKFKKDILAAVGMKL